MNVIDFDTFSKLALGLFPINRSVVGEGYDESLNLIGKHLPLEVFELRSGKIVFDWKIPKGWRLETGAGVFNLDGSVAIDLSKNNLHIVSHSEPINDVMTGAELKALMYTIPENPDWIPYVTSYYKDLVGFCVTHSQSQTIIDSSLYRLYIPALKYEHSLKRAEVYIPGQTEEEILITSYLCHPSMGNNELSGPLAWVRLASQMLDRRGQNKFSYRFILAPETIGSIAWLATRFPEVSTKVRYAVVLTCLGGPKKKLSIKLSNSELVNQRSTDLDDFARLGEQEDRWEIREFTPLNGSDERHFSSPGVRIPTIQIARTVYGDYPEYHTNADDLEFMNVKQVFASSNEIFELLCEFEGATEVASSRIHGGEPQLGKRDLYPTTSTPRLHYGSARENLTYGEVSLDEILTTYHLSDGRSIIDIAKTSGLPLSSVIRVIDLLKSKSILQ